MSTRGKGQFSVAQSGWLMALLFFGWLAFLLLPGPKPKPAPLPPFVVKAPSRIVALGLADNPDLEHLPEYFALYADKAEWKDDKTVFAYWHPGAQRFEYFFEATRNGKKYYFKALEESKRDGGYWEEDSPNDVPIRFWRPWPATESPRLPSSISTDPAAHPNAKVELNLKPGKIIPPDVKFHSLDLSQNN